MPSKDWIDKFDKDPEHAMSDSYDIVCPAYKDTKQAEFAKAWLTYVTSDEGQKAAQDAAGTAPLPSSLKSEITKSIEVIKTK
jgi:phosphate transport system substrate-binding protein